MSCDPTGARTQDPNIKSVVLYQLSYRVNKRYFVIQLGFEPKTYCLEGSCSIQLSYWTLFWERQHKMSDHKYLSINRSEEHTSELQSRPHLVCRLLLEKK